MPRPLLILPLLLLTAAAPTTTPAPLGSALLSAVEQITETSPLPPVLTLLPAVPPPPVPPAAPPTQPTTRPLRTDITFAGTTLSIPTPLIIVRYSTREDGKVTSARRPPNPVEVRLTSPDGVDTRSFADVTTPPDVVKGEDKWSKLTVNGKTTPIDGRTTAIEFPRSTAADSQGEVALYVSTPHLAITWAESPERLRIRKALLLVDFDGGFAQLFYKAADDLNLPGDKKAALTSARDDLLKLTDLELFRATAAASPDRLAATATPEGAYPAALLLLSAVHATAPTGTKPFGGTVHETTLKDGRTLLALVPTPAPNARRQTVALNLFSPDGTALAAFTVSFAPDATYPPDHLLPELLRLLGQ